MSPRPAGRTACGRWPCTSGARRSGRPSACPTRTGRSSSRHSTRRSRPARDSPRGARICRRCRSVRSTPGCRRTSRLQVCTAGMEGRTCRPCRGPRSSRHLSDKGHPQAGTRGLGRRRDPGLLPPGSRTRASSTARRRCTAPRSPRIPHLRRRRHDRSRLRTSRNRPWNHPLRRSPRRRPCPPLHPAMRPDRGRRAAPWSMRTQPQRGRREPCEESAALPKNSVVS